MNCERIYDDRNALLSRHVAEPFNQNESDERLVVAQPRVH